MRRAVLPFALLFAAAGGGAPVPAAAGTCMVPPNPLKAVSSRFGIFRTPGQHGSAAKRGHMHDGLDFSTGGKTPLYATADGKVVFKGYWGGYGNSLVIERPNGHTFRYSHMSGFADSLAEGSEVKAGQQIGIAGNTGGGKMAVHLHFSYGVPGQQEVRAKQFYADAGKLKSLNPTQLPTVLRNGGRGLGWKTDPSPYFCEAFPIQDGRGDRFGKTTKAQYALLYGDAPDGGAPPELAAARMQQAEAAANGQSIEEFLTDSDGYGAPCRDRPSAHPKRSRRGNGCSRKRPGASLAPTGRTNCRKSAARRCGWTTCAPTAYRSIWRTRSAARSSRSKR